MVVTVNALQIHINKLNQGILNFSDCEMNSRADLVRFEGYSIVDAANLPEWKVYDILDQKDECPNGLNRMIEVSCQSCKHPEMEETDYSDYDDCYTLRCPNCKKEIRIHYTGYDSILDGIEYSKQYEIQALPIVKMLQKHCSVYIDRSIEKTISTQGKLIQCLDILGDVEEFWELNNEYYYIGLNSGKFKCNNKEDWETINNYLIAAV